MNPTIEQQHIASLILKERVFELNESERKKLDSWRQADPQNEKIYAHLSKKDFSNDLSRYPKIDVSKGLERYQKGISSRKVHRSTKWYWAAAVAVFIIGVSTIFLSQETNHKLPHRISVAPGSSKAMLVMDDGHVINLADKNQTEISTSEGLSIQNNGSELKYTLPKETPNNRTIVYNELIIPKGGEFTLTLSDGTKVWLNSQSKLKYPVVFSDSTREVILEGEAYFKVMKDAEHPFCVHANDKVCIEVLGTSFNVRCYSDEDKIETVLEEGSVRVQQGKETVVLTPGHKAVCVPNDTIEVQPVKTEEYTAWKQGQYVFTNESVENILKRLSRWYNIEVFYSNDAAKKVTFSGDVQKYENINTFLEAMEIAGGVSFQIKNEVIVVDYK